jgi:hypothetical protein
MSHAGMSKIFITFTSLCLIATITNGCKTLDPDIALIARELDELAKNYEKFGTASISSPILIESKAKGPNDPNQRYFDFDLHAGPDKYYKDARSDIQGSSAMFNKVMEIFELGMRLELLKCAESKPNLTDANIPSYLKLPAERPKCLLDPNLAPKVPNRSAITTAAGDTVTEGIFKLLGNPGGAVKFKDKIMMFGVSMITVNPGWLTRKNYTAELAVSCDYYYDFARRELLIQLRANEKKQSYPDNKLIRLLDTVLDSNGLIGVSEVIDKLEVIDVNNPEKTSKEEIKMCATEPNSVKKIRAVFKENILPERLQKEFREQYTPLAAAVSPMTDVYALDLSSTQLRQITEALTLAANIPFPRAEAGGKLVKTQDKLSNQDVRTRTACAAITAFSNGCFFGFRVRPRLAASENPAEFGGKPENVLEPQTFPIAVIIGFDADDLQIGFDVERDEQKGTGEPKCYENGTKVRLIAYEPLLSFRQTTNWLPENSCKERFGETERLGLLCSYNKATNHLKELKERKIVDSNDVEIIGNRISLFKNNTLNSWNAQYIPMELMIKANKCY